LHDENPVESREISLVFTFLFLHSNNEYFAAMTTFKLTKPTQYKYKLFKHFLRKILPENIKKE